MSHQTEIEKKKYRNWVRGCLAFKYLKYGIERFANDIANKEHMRILEDVSKSGKTCNSCEFNCLKPLHKKVPYHNGKFKCPWNQKNCNCLYDKKKKCPKDICDAILEDILNTYDFQPSSPNWKNTNMQKWCTSPCEITKCFINSSGYFDKESVLDIDHAGLLHVFINNINFQHQISTTIDGRDVFSKTIERRNIIFHSSNMELEDSEVNECIDDIITILEDEKKLRETENSKQAVGKLIELKQKTFIITTHDEVEVCREAVRSINNSLNELKTDIQDVKDDYRQQAIAMSALDERVKQRLYEIEVNKKGLEDSQSIQKQKGDFQENLRKLYSEHYINTWISIFKTKDNTISIQNVYVTPNIVEEADELKSTGKKKCVSRYKDIFHSDDKDYKKIYILGDVGTGKSSFCKMMIFNWCQAIKSDNTDNDDVIEMKAFSFLFYVPLQRFQNFSHDLTDMIKEVYKHVTSEELIDNILFQEEDRCLIIVDSLDEWIPPKRPCPLLHVTYGIPVGDGIKNATIITLSRPYAKGILEMRDSEFDRKLTLLGIKANDVNEFTCKYMASLNQANNDQKMVKEFKIKMKQFYLKHLEESPLLLQQMICIYCKDGEIGKSVCDIYSKILNIKLGWYDKKQTGTRKETFKADPNESANIKFPYPLEIYPRIVKNKLLIYILGKLAYEDLVSSNFSNTFGAKALESMNLADNDLTSLKKVGFLVEHNAIDNEYEDTYISFIHLSYLEFFAAVYITSTYFIDKSILKDCFLKFKSTDFLKLSNILLMICAMSPSMLEDISLSMAITFKEDESLVNYRKQLNKNGKVNYRKTLNIQRLLYRCYLECSKDEQGMIYLCDVIINDRTDTDFLSKIKPGYIMSLSLGYGTYFIEFTMLKKIFKWMSELKELPSLCLSVGTLYPVEFSDMLINKVKVYHLSLKYDNNTELVYGSERKEVIDSYSDHLLAVLKQLSQVNSRFIETISIFGPKSYIKSHRVCTTLSSSLIHAVSLKHLTVKGIRSDSIECDTHIIHLSGNKNLKHLDVEYFKFMDISDCIETITLETPITFGKTSNLAHNDFEQFAIAKICDSISSAVSLIDMSLKCNNIYGGIDEGRMSIDISKLAKLETINLVHCPFTLRTQNILTGVTHINIEESVNFSHDLKESLMLLITLCVTLKNLTLKLTKCRSDECKGHDLVLPQHPMLKDIHVTSPFTTLALNTSFYSMEYIVFVTDGIPFTHDTCDKLAAALGNCVSLKSMTLKNVQCSHENCGGHVIELTRLNQIETVRLNACSLALRSDRRSLKEISFNDKTLLSHENCKLLSTALSLCESLETLRLSDISCCSADCIVYMIDVSKLHIIEKVDINNSPFVIYSDKDNESLKQIVINGFKGTMISHENCERFSISFSRFSSLKSVSLSKIVCDSQSCNGHTIDLSRIPNITILVEDMYLFVVETVDINYVCRKDYTVSLPNYASNECISAIFNDGRKRYQGKSVMKENIDLCDILYCDIKESLSEEVVVYNLNRLITRLKSQISSFEIKSQFIIKKQPYTCELNMAINSLENLKCLTISGHRIEPDALYVTTRMNTLGKITINLVMMSLSTWQTFIDSVCVLEQDLCVDMFLICVMQVTDEGKEIQANERAVEYIRKFDNKCIQSQEILLDHLCFILMGPLFTIKFRKFKAIN